MSYKDFLLSIAKVDAQVYWLFQHFGEGNFCVGGDATPALFGWEMGQPRFAGLHLEPTPNGVLEELAGVQHGRQVEAPGPSVHFPDRNATGARLLVRHLIREALAGKTQEHSGAARVNYAVLAQPGSRQGSGSTPPPQREAPWRSSKGQGSGDHL